MNRIRHVSRLLTGTRAEDVTYHSQTTCGSLRLPSFVSFWSFCELAYGPGSASFRTTAHTDLSSTFFLHLLTPIDFISFLIRFNHPNFGLPFFFSSVWFPQKYFLDGPITRRSAHQNIKIFCMRTCTWTEFKCQPVCCRDIIAVGKVIREGVGPPRTRGLIPVEARDLSFLQTFHTACGHTCASFSMSTG